MKIPPLATAAAAALALATLTGCGNSDASSGDSALTLDRVKDLAEQTEAGAAECPVDYDLRKAAKAAGLQGRVGPLDGKDAAQGEVPDPDVPKPQDMLEGVEGVLLECAYELNGEEVRIFTVGAGNGWAPNILLPTLQATDGMSMAELRAFSTEAGEADPGRTVPTPNDTAAVVRLPEKGGDIALAFATAGDDTALKPDEVSRIAKELASQVEG